MKREMEIGTSRLYFIRNLCDWGNMKNHNGNNFNAFMYL